jgi:hypothetical protein
LGQVLDLKTKLISIFAAAVICLGADSAMAAHAGLSSATSADATAHAKPVSVTPEEAERGPSQKPVEIARMFGFPITNSMVFSWIVAVGLIVFAQVATRQMKPVPDGAQNFWEWLVEGLYTFLEGIIGSGNHVLANFHVLAAIRRNVDSTPQVSSAFRKTGRSSSIAAVTGRFPRGRLQTA